MGNVAIRVEGLGKKYRIGSKQEKYKTFRDAVTRTALWPLRMTQSLIRGGGRHQEAGEIIWALKNVSFEINHGEVVGIIGRNGAGKSTLLKVLSRIADPTEGYADIYGRVGSLLEVGTGFHPELTGRENIYLNGAILGMRRAEIDSKFDEIVAFAEVEKFIDTPVKHYSSGMGLRLGFAIAAYLEPEILIVDEVLAVGDIHFQKKCLGKMGDVATQGRTVLFVSHNMNAVAALCTRGIVLEQGAKVFDGGIGDATERYQNHSVEGRAQTRWNPETAPRGRYARLLEVGVLSNGENVGKIVSTEKPIQIYIRFEVVVPMSKVGTSIVLYDADGTIIFVSIGNHEPEWHMKPRPEGVYRNICEIPENLLASGRYSVSVVLWEDAYISGITESNAIHFVAQEEGLVRGDVPREIKGVIRPLLKWTSVSE